MISSNLVRLSCHFKVKSFFGMNDDIMVLVCEGFLSCSISITIVQGIANNFGRLFLVHFGLRHCHNLEVQFVVSLSFASGKKPTFKTTAGSCVAQPKGFAWKECRALTPTYNVHRSPPKCTDAPKGDSRCGRRNHTSILARSQLRAFYHPLELP